MTLDLIDVVALCFFTFLITFSFCTVRATLQKEVMQRASPTPPCNSVYFHYRDAMKRGECATCEELNRQNELQKIIQRELDKLGVFDKGEV